MCIVLNGHSRPSPFPLASTMRQRLCSGNRITVTKVSLYPWADSGRRQHALRREDTQMDSGLHKLSSEDSAQIARTQAGALAVTLDPYTKEVAMLTDQSLIVC